MIRLDDKVQGFTTNPTLMRKAGVKDYKSWAKIILDRFPTKPVSFEVIADDFTEMERQARLLASWGPNVYVKIPITNTQGDSAIPLIERLEGINLNVTAVMTEEQIDSLRKVMKSGIVSIFAGRIADTGRDPMHYVAHAAQYGMPYEVLWASAREVYNVYQAEQCGANIITLPPDLLYKLHMKGKSLELHSLDTVDMFYEDAQKAGYSL